MVVRAGKIILTYFKLNLAAAMEYRLPFLAQVLGMMINNAVAFFFWWAYFLRFREIGGWVFHDVVLLWSIVSIAFGISSVLFGNGFQLARVIAQGELDYYLTQPGDILLHTLISKSIISGWGDVSFGLIAFALVGSFSFTTLGLFTLCLLTSTIVFVSFLVILGSLAFFFGNAEASSSQAQGALVMFATYPSSAFEGWLKILLFTGLPAALIGYLPVELLKKFDPLNFSILIAGTVVFWCIAMLIFYYGLRRYESGNLMSLRG